MNTANAVRAPRPLTHRGPAAVLAVVERHAWNLSRAARELGVTEASARSFLRRRAPAALAAARAAGRIRTTREPLLTDARALAAALDRYHWRVLPAARALGCSGGAVYRAMARLGVARPGACVRDLTTGWDLGRLRALRLVSAPRTARRWACLCDPTRGGCGAEIVALESRLAAGRVRSCGCLRARTQAAWGAMRQAVCAARRAA